MLDPRCVDVPCNATSTCSGRQCVPSTVECTERGCSEPGVGPDGGVIVVDGGRPIPPEDGGLDAGGDAALDAGGGDAALDGATGSDAGKIAGECGVSACPLTGPNAMSTQCPVSAEMACCISGFDLDGGVAASCLDRSLCTAYIAACCAGTDMCETGRRCCADKPTALQGTKIACGFPQQCSQNGGSNTFICRTPSGGAPSPECPENLRCSLTDPFGPPGLYRCMP